MCKVSGVTKKDTLVELVGGGFVIRVGFLSSLKGNKCIYFYHKMYTLNYLLNLRLVKHDFAETAPT